MAVSTYIEDRRSGRRAFARNAQEFRARLGRLREELERERRARAADARESSPAADELRRRARTARPLWERRPTIPTSSRSGSAAASSGRRSRSVSTPAAATRCGARPTSSADWYSTVPAAPVLLPLAELGAAGLCGPDERVDALARWLVAQAAALHSPRELAIAAALHPQRADGLGLAQVAAARLAETSPMGGSSPARTGRAVAASRRRPHGLGPAARGRRRRSGRAGRRGRPHVLLVLDEHVAPERASSPRCSPAPARHGVAVLWLGRERRDLPGESGGSSSSRRSRPRLTLTDARAGAGRRTSPPTASRANAREVALGARAGARTTSTGAAAEPCRAPSRCSSCSASATSTRTRVAARWRDAQRGLGALVGAARDGPFSIDLRADGPHALVAGTTGAGKSELLQTLVAVARRLAPARPAHVPARRLQGRRGVQGLRRPAAHGRLRHRPRRAPDPARAHLAERRAPAPRARPPRRGREGPARPGARDPGERARRAW